MKKDFLKGVSDGLPIGLGYFSVAFGFGIMAVGANISAFFAWLISASNMTSAGQVIIMMLFIPCHVKIPNSKNKIPKTIVVVVVFLFCIICFVNIIFLMHPTRFIAIPVYAPNKKYCSANIPSLRVLKIKIELCFLHWKDIMLAIIPSPPINCIITSIFSPP